MRKRDWNDELRKDLMRCPAEPKGTGFSERRAMSEEEIKAYLMRWLMEFGVGETTYVQRAATSWYKLSSTQSCVNSFLRPYIKYDGRRSTAQITPAGLDMIRK